MAQQIIPATQLVPKFQCIERCNKYVVLQSIPCSPKHKIVGKILLDHPLSYALTAIDDVPAVYLQQFWKTIHKDPRFIKLIIANLMEKYPSIPRRHEEDYQSIKDDTLLVSVYSTGNVLFRGIRIPYVFLTAKIRATDDYKKYETVTPTLTVASPHGKKGKQRARETSDDRERDEVAEATILSLTLHKTDLAAESHENIAKVQEKLDEEEIERMVEGEEDEESYASKFSDSMLNDDVDDFGTRIEPESYKEHPENVNDDDEEIEKEKKDDEI
ncbi:hypothetical protein Tco_0587572 [Tanacetum coccineum]